MGKFKINIKNGCYVLNKRENPKWRLLIAEGMGKEEGEIIRLHPLEVSYLILKRRVDESHTRLDLEEIIYAECTKDKEFMTKFITYLDLRERGFPIKVSGPSPIVFEVYDRGADVSVETSRRYLMVVHAEKSIGIETLSTALEMAKRDDKDLVLAIVDQDGDIVYYKVDTALKFQVSIKLRKSRGI